MVRLRHPGRPVPSGGLDLNPPELNPPELNPPELNPLERWLADTADALGVGEAWSAADRDLVLDLARDVAHRVARPAAPLTTYLAGIAVGRGLSPAEAAARVDALVAARPASPGPQPS